MIPPTAELAWNAIAHGVSESARGFRLQNFLEVAALVAGGGQLNWTAIHERAAAEEACDSDTGVRVRASVVFRWLDAALALTAAGTAARPEWLSSFDLQGLLEWRVKSIETRRRFGRRFADGMMEEGALALIGLPMQKAPAGRAWPIQVRRRAASTASRLLFRAWSAGRSA
jgi:hypothetical protein